MVFSTVRSNISGSVGFLDDWRRTNVAITRPKRLLVIVGNSATLAGGDGTWAAYLAWIRQLPGCVVTGLPGLALLGWRV